MNIESLLPEQTTLPLKIFVFLRFIFKIAFWWYISWMIIFNLIIPLIGYGLKITFEV